MAGTTIRDVASHAGVSVATVSRVINGGAGVSPTTIQRVLASISEIQYIPNAPARNLKTDTTHTVGFLISNISNSHFTSMAKIIEQNLRMSSYSVVVCNTDDNPEIERDHLKRLLGLRVDGIILNTTGQNDDYIVRLSQNNPIVLVDRNIGKLNFRGDFVGSNGHDGMRALTRHLIQCGHRDIGIITSNLRTSTGRERLAGFTDAMADIGIEVDENYMYRYDGQFFNVDDGITGCHYLMNLDRRPTAIVVANNDMAIGAYKYLHSNGIAVPGDVSVVSYGNINNSELFWVEPTYTTLNPAFIGEKAADLLLSRMRNREIGNREVIFEPLLLVNGTTQRI